MSEDERTLYVSGFHDDRVTEEILYELFLQAGPLEKVTIPKDKNTGAPRKFAFVTFQHAVSTPYAINIMQDVSLYGRLLNIKHRGGGGKESPRASPSSSPHGRHYDQPQYPRNGNNYNRSNTWHGSDSHRSPQSGPIFSPPPSHVNPYAQMFNASNVLRGQSHGMSMDLSAMQPRSQDSMASRRQRVLDQQQLSLNHHGHCDRNSHRSEERNNGYRERDNRSRSYHPYDDRDRRRR